MGWDELNDKTKRYVRGMTLAGGLLLGSIFVSAQYDNYKERQCASIAINAEAEQARDKTLEKHIETYCKDRRKASNVDDCNHKIVAVKDCCAEVEYRLDKVDNAGKPAGCLIRTFGYEFNPIFNQWSDGERLSQKTNSRKCSYKPRKRKKTWRQKVGGWVSGR